MHTRSIIPALLLVVAAPAAHASTSVTTFHYDNWRTGWNQTETALTPSNVASSAFGLTAQVALDEQVDAQPLFVPALTIAGGVHDVVYVATEANTVFAIDAGTGAVLLSKNLGKAVGYKSLPHRCGNNSAVVGITSTPVIDPVAQAMYVMAYTSTNGTSAFYLHQLSLATLTDMAPPVLVTAQATLSDGTTTTFNATYQRQRAALLESNGNIYAGFASYCDAGGNVSRGWVLGWQASTLTPLPASHLNDTLATSTDNYFLSSVWMSGFGIAADAQGNLYFSTGNSDYNGQSYSPAQNLSESVVRLSGDLTMVSGFYTVADHAKLDMRDFEIGSGGVMLVPPQGNAPVSMAVASGKANGIYLLNTANFGTTAAEVYHQYLAKGCWCGPSLFQAPDGTTRIVTTNGAGPITLWQLTQGPKAHLTQLSVNTSMISGLDPGFFSTVSSNGITAGSAIVWALPHPANTDSTFAITLNAFDPKNSMQQIASLPAGNWPNAHLSNPNLSPVVANGHVFVATYKQLSIFGLSAAPAAFHFAPIPETMPTPDAAHVLHGITTSISFPTLTIRLRTGATATIDMSQAASSGNVAEPGPGDGVLVLGDSYERSGALHATAVLHGRAAPALWDPDR